VPGSHHIPGSKKANRMYEHIKQSEEASGKAENISKRIAAATVNKYRSDHGETKKKHNATKFMGDCE
jgi:hypothetical protein